MPRKRNTVVNKRAKPKVSDEDICNDGDIENQRYKLEVFLRDFDIEVQKKLSKIEQEKARLQALIEKEINIQLNAIHPDIRAMNIMDFVAAGGTVEAALLKLQPGDFAEIGIEDLRTVKKSTSKNTCKRKYLLEKSTIASQCTSTVKQRRLRTPANRNFPATLRTPAITPKFDICAPFTPGMARGPRHGETLMSLAGSPVDISVTQKKVQKVKHARIEEEEDIDGTVEKVALNVPDVSKADIHRILSLFTAAAKVTTD